MTDQEKKLRSDLRFEIRARRVALKRIDSPLAHAKAAAEKAKAKRAERVAKASEYENYQDAQEAYGFGVITEEEFDDIVDALENGEEYVNNTKSPEEAAYEILREFVCRLNGDIAALEFELLPEKEKEKARQRNMEIIERRKQRGTL